MPRIPYGTKYTVTVKGGTWKPVACGNCGGVYYYHIKHETTGSATDVLWLNKQGTINSAETNASQNLDKYLKNTVSNYSCPDCGFYQTEMIRRMKNDIWQKALFWGVMGLMGVAAITAVLGSDSLIYPVIGGVVVAVIYLSKLNNFDPNTDASTRINQQFSEKYPVLRKSEIEYLRRSNS